jgi:hypothetical protein
MVGRRDLRATDLKELVEWLKSSGGIVVLAR